MPDLTAKDIEAAMKIIAGTARSMGVTVEGAGADGAAAGGATA
jgi:large subunit ribosomal protein L11